MNQKPRRELPPRRDPWDWLVPIGLIIGFLNPFPGFSVDTFGFLIFFVGLLAKTHKLWKEGRVTPFVFLQIIAAFVFVFSFGYQGFILSKGSEVPTLTNNVLIGSHGKDYYITESQNATYSFLSVLFWISLIIGVLGNEISIYIIERRRK